MLELVDLVNNPAPTCGPVAALTATLERDYGERFVDFRLVAPDRAVLLYGNPATGTWTVIVRGPRGGGCVAGSGQGFVGPTLGEDS